MTVDVESFSISLNRCDDTTAKRVYEEALPVMLDLFSKYDIQATFFFTGMIAERFPDAVQQVFDQGHEIGCHGYNHANDRAFDILSYEEQIADMSKAKKILTDIVGPVESFRAPALRLNENSVRALEATQFRNDSSICSQRFDGPFTFGSKRKIKWLGAPRSPYFLSYDSVCKRGTSTIFEVPISAMIFPYSGTLLRRTPNMTKILQWFLYQESKNTENPVTFLIHPNEFIPAEKIVVTRRAKNPVEYIFADVIRQRLKIKNLGPECVRLLDDLLASVKKFEPEYISISSYKQKFG
jgi:peptidoglycan/xylan/chitin deacetylase (PgdA/CDA1 family)